MGVPVTRVFFFAFAPPLPLTSATTATTMKTVKIPARLRRFMGLAPVLEFELSSVRLCVVVIVFFLCPNHYVCHRRCRSCQVASSYRRQQVT